MLGLTMLQQRLKRAEMGEIRGMEVYQASVKSDANTHLHPYDAYDGISSLVSILREGRRPEHRGHPRTDRFSPSADKESSVQEKG